MKRSRGRLSTMRGTFQLPISVSITVPSISFLRGQPRGLATRDSPDPPEAAPAGSFAGCARSARLWQRSRRRRSSDLLRPTFHFRLNAEFPEHTVDAGSVQITNEQSALDCHCRADTRLWCSGLHRKSQPARPTANDRFAFSGRIVQRVATIMSAGSPRSGLIGTALVAVPIDRP
jgi:hypothetical protein